MAEELIPEIAGLLDTPPSLSQLAQRFGIPDPQDVRRLATMLGIGFLSGFEKASIGIAMLDLHGRFLAANRALYELLAVGDTDLRGKEFDAFIHPDDPPVYAHYTRQMLNDRQSFRRLDTRGIDSAGSTLWLHISVSPIYDAADHPQWILLQISDMSAGRRMQEALYEREELYRSLVNASPDAILLSRLDGIILFCNQQTAVMLGYDRIEDIIGHDTFMLIAHEEHERIRALSQTSRELGAIFSLELMLRRKDGSHLLVEARASVVQDATGAPHAYMSHFRDITEHKQFQAAERESRVLAEALKDTAAALNSTLNYEQVLDRILENAGRVVPHDAANIMLVDPLTDEAYVARARGYAEHGLEEWVRQLRFPLTHLWHLKQMYQSGQPLIVSNVALDSNWVQLADSDWLQSFAAAPIRIKGQTIGFLNFDSATRGFFTPAHIERLQAFADQAAVAIENARLFKTARHNVTHLTLLHHAGLALAQTETLEALYHEILYWARQQAGVSKAALSLFDGIDHVMIVAASGMPQESIGRRYALGEGITGRAAQQRRSLQTSAYDQWPGKLSTPSSRDIVSILALPLMWQQQLVGTLTVADSQKLLFDSEDIHMLELFAALAAAAIEQRRALAEVQVHATEAHALSARLAHAQEEERARISTQLHDAIGFRLVELQKNTEMVLSALGSDHAQAAHLLNNLAVLRETHQLTHTLALDLSAKVLADLGIGPASRQYTERLAATTGVKIRLHFTGRVRRLPADIERVAFRGLQEAVIHALHQSHAAEITAHLHFSARSLRLTVEDNGRGPTDDSRENAVESTVLDLPDLRQQVESLHGDFMLENVPGHATVVTIVLPIRRTAAAPGYEKIRALIVDDHEMTRAGLRAILAEDGDFVCVGEAGDGLEAVHQVEVNHPNLVIMDVQLPRLSGIEATRQITRLFPSVNVVMLANDGDEASLQESFQAGARGYLVRSDSGRRVVNALRVVRNGEIYVSPDLSAAWTRLQMQPAVKDPLEPLTLRERQVFQLIVSGVKNLGIAEQLGISVRTVEVHRRNLMSKLGLKNLSQMMQYANHNNAAQ